MRYRHPISILLAALMLAGCAQTPATPTPLPIPTGPLFTPTPTALFEGLTTRLATPDPSPECPDHYPWFFENRARECAATLLTTWGAFQPFERGLMLWIQEGGRTFVMLDDGSPFKPYYELTDAANALSPEPDPNIIPPPGLYQPVLGFARFWRGLAPNSWWVHESLGWATATEIGYGIRWQCNTATDETARCYFTGPRDEIFVITQGNAKYWNYWQKPVR